MKATKSQSSQQDSEGMDRTRRYPRRLYAVLYQSSGVGDKVNPSSVDEDEGAYRSHAGALVALLDR
jgi:hypothetical protein